MKKLRKYNKYHSVSYDYVKELPKGWKLLPNIAIFQERIERGFINEELLSVTINRGVIKQSEVDIKKDSSNEDKSKYKLIKIGDIAYNKMRMWQGALGYSTYQGISSPAYVILKSKMKINPKFFHYMFRTVFYTNYSKRYSYGIVDDQLSLRYIDFKRMYSIVPPLGDQNDIVSYLDRKNAQIQEFICKKERLIDLLEIDKGNSINAIINRYSLSVSRLKFLCKKITDGSHSSPSILAAGRNYVTVTDIGKNNTVDLVNCKKISDLDFEILERTGCRPLENDILLSKDGTIGRAFIVTKNNNFVVLSSLAIITPIQKKINSELLRLILIGPICVDQMFSKIQGSALTRLTIGLIKNLKISFPQCLEDQSDALAKIKIKHALIDDAIFRARIEIKKIKEYQDSLITNIVTGVVKVPESDNQKVKG